MYGLRNMGQRSRSLVLFLLELLKKRRKIQKNSKDKTKILFQNEKEVA